MTATLRTGLAWIGFNLPDQSFGILSHTFPGAIAVGVRGRGMPWSIWDYRSQSRHPTEGTCIFDCVMTAFLLLPNLFTHTRGAASATVTNRTDRLDATAFTAQDIKHTFGSVGNAGDWASLTIEEMHKRKRDAWHALLATMRTNYPRSTFRVSGLSAMDVFEACIQGDTHTRREFKHANYCAACDEWFPFPPTGSVRQKFQAHLIRTSDASAALPAVNGMSPLARCVEGFFKEHSGVSTSGAVPNIPGPPPLAACPLCTGPVTAAKVVYNSLPETLVIGLTPAVATAVNTDCAADLTIVVPSQVLVRNPNGSARSYLAKLAYTYQWEGGIYENADPVRNTRHGRLFMHDDLTDSTSGGRNHNIIALYDSCFPWHDGAIFGDIPSYNQPHIRVPPPYCNSPRLLFFSRVRNENVQNVLQARVAAAGTAPVPPPPVVPWAVGQWNGIAPPPPPPPPQAPPPRRSGRSGRGGRSAGAPDGTKARKIKTRATTNALWNGPNGDWPDLANHCCASAN